MKYFRELFAARAEISKFPEIDTKVGAVVSLGMFIDHGIAALTIAFREKEIFVFSILQWLVVALAYFLWVQMLDWIPEDVWRSTENSDSGSIADIILLIWSFACVGLAAYPIGILSGCIGAAFLLKRLKRKCTIATCLRLVMPQSVPLWLFHWFDGWITAMQILERLPRKNPPTPLEHMRREALYYAWKVASAGMLPSILTGNGLARSGVNSVKFAWAHLRDVQKLRLGYSICCWVIGIGTYVLAVLWLNSGILAPYGTDIYGKVYWVYLWVALPMLAGVLVVIIFLRPVFLLGIGNLYLRYLAEKGEAVTLPKTEKGYMNGLAAFGVLMIFIAVAYVYRNELGIVDMLSVPYDAPERYPVPWASSN